MRRRNVQDAFVGEGTGAHDTGELPSLEELDDAVEYEIKEGTTMLVVPHGTPDEDVFENYTRIGFNITLEDGTMLSITIEEGSEGVTISKRSSESPEPDEHFGLSALKNVPGAI